jgi:hypothetical protein
VARDRQPVAAAPADQPAEDLSTVVAVPHLVFRHTALGPDYGRVAVVPLASPDGPRHMTPATCQRVFAVTGGALCLFADRGFVTTYAATLYDGDWNRVRDWPLLGLPSRARLSADGQLTATTTFVYGDSYAAPGQFSTRTIIGRTDSSSNEDLEQFSLVIDGSANTAIDRNIWGVTFVDDDAFFATAATGGRTWLVRGSIAGRTLTAVRSNVECPSLSPDRSRVAFKKAVGPGRWRIAVLDLATGAETVLAEERSVDDQVVWLDDEHILYGMARTGEQEASADVWVVAADGSGQPRVFLTDAWSPAVVR